MVQSVDNQCNILAHIAVDIIWFGEQLRCLIDQVCSQNTCQNTLFISLIKLLKSICEESECSSGKNAVRFSAFQFGCNFNDTFS